MTDHPAYLRWTPADTIEHDDGMINVIADCYQRRDGKWQWTAQFAAYKVTFDTHGNSTDTLGPFLSSGPQFADTEAAARARCEWWIEKARCDRLGLTFMKEAPRD